MPGIDVCVVGSANLDLVARVARLPAPGETVLGTDYAEHAGGKGLNQAVAAARSGAATSFVGAVGDDDAGRRLRAVIAAESVDDRSTIVPGTPTGRALICVDDQGENAIVVVAGANGALHHRIDLPPCATVLTQLEIPLDTVAATLHVAAARGTTTVLNPAPARELPSDLLASIDVIVPNEHEVELLGGADALLAAGCGAVLTTLGPRGAELRTADGRRVIDPFDVDPIDTTGAGDAFCGALAARLAAGDDLATAARWASAAGALATTVHGAVPAQPRADAIAALVAP